MAHYDQRLSGIEYRPVHDGGAQDGSDHDGGASGGAPRGDAPRESRPRQVWLWLAAGIVALVAGIVIGHGLLIAAGLVVAGMAGQLLEPRRRSGRRSAVPRPR
ncbi:hypothetical protein ABZ802_06805 [Streptomyces sp. NPDC047737]|jgi:hypothetical protein|uniref:hypothetical protein n=1 Tax=unclassified Streptomyces TaxID=2593676 RepID=UPI0033DEAB48